MSDLGVFFIWAGLYALLLAGLSVWARRGNRTSRDLLISETRPVGILALVFTFAATLMSAFFMVGMPGFSYAHGTLLWPYVIFGDIFSLLLLFLLGKRFYVRLVELRSSGQADLISPLEVIFPDRSSRVVFVLFTSLFIVPYLGVQIAGFGRLLSVTSDGTISLIAAAAIPLVFIWIYSAVSGIRGIIFTDVLQGALLIVGALVVAIALFSTAFGFTFEGVSSFVGKLVEGSPEHLGSPGPVGFGTFPVLFSSFLMFSAIMITQPQFLTRLMLIRPEDSDRYLKNLILGLGIALSVFGLPILLIGMIGVTEFPDLATGDQLFGNVLNSIFPGPVAIGFTVVVLAAAMSTADSILYAIGHMIYRDVLANVFGVGRADVSAMIVVRLTLLILAIFALIIGLSSSTLIVQLSALTFAGCLQLVPAIVGGLWDKLYTSAAGVASMLSGVIVVLFGGLADIAWPFGFMPAVYGLIAACVVYLAMSRLLPKFGHIATEVQE